MLLLKDVKKSFAEPGGGRLPILDVPAFAVKAGEQLALVGQSGCGKTTLLHIIAGIARPDSGSVEINGRDIAAAAGSRPRPLPRGAHRLRFSDVQFAARFSALENVLLGMSFWQRQG